MQERHTSTNYPHIRERVEHFSAPLKEQRGWFHNDGLHTFDTRCGTKENKRLLAYGTHGRGLGFRLDNRVWNVVEVLHPQGWWPEGACTQTSYANEDIWCSEG